MLPMSDQARRVALFADARIDEATEAVVRSGNRGPEANDACHGATGENPSKACQSGSLHRDQDDSHIAALLAEPHRNHDGLLGAVPKDNLNEVAAVPLAVQGEGALGVGQNNPQNGRIAPLARGRELSLPARKRQREASVLGRRACPAPVSTRGSTLRPGRTGTSRTRLG